MPAIYANNHNNIIKNYLDTKEQKQINKEKLVFGKNKYGYIFLITILLKPVALSIKENN